MPQELQVLTCYRCETFQVQIVTKARKWTCKMCGEKQSIKKIYFRGTGKECREIVQDLNAKRIQLEESTNLLDLSNMSEKSDDCEAFENYEIDKEALQQNCYKSEGNKWDDLLPEKEEEEQKESEDESEKYTFERKIVKRKSRSKKLKVAYGDCDNDCYNYTELKRNKREHDVDVRNVEENYKNHESLQEDNTSDFREDDYFSTSTSNGDYSKQNAGIYLGTTSQNIDKYNKRTNNLNPSKSINKWTEDLSEQSDEDSLEEGNEIFNHKINEQTKYSISEEILQDGILIKKHQKYSDYLNDSDEHFENESSKDSGDFSYQSNNEGYENFQPKWSRSLSNQSHEENEEILEFCNENLNYKIDSLENGYSEKSESRSSEGDKENMDMFNKSSQKSIKNVLNSQDNSRKCNLDNIFEDCDVDLELGIEI